jgi:abortive infection bacteriophage resistance protein
MKPFLSIEQQIELLSQDKNLIIDDIGITVSALKRIGYFGLIGGYKEAFKNPTTGKFRDGTHFSDILALYDFDEELRELFLRYILHIERNIRQLLSYYFTEAHGVNQKEYLDSSNYTASNKAQNAIAKLIHKLDVLANHSSNYAYIVHQRSAYGNVPLWVLINALTFGSLSKFVMLMTADIKAKIAIEFSGVNERHLCQYLSVLTMYRNLCAHQEKLFSYKNRKDIPDTLLHKKLSIAKAGKQYSLGKHDLFSLVITFRYMLPNTEFKSFKITLMRLMTRYLKSSNAITEISLNKMMGFPENWRTITRYKK